MPFQIIRNDITKVKADAIVNTANPLPIIGGGTDSAIYKAAGKDKLLKDRKKIGEIAPGDAVSTKAYKLQAKHIIHTVGPAWDGGDKGEFDTLRSCYSKSLQLAKDLKCESVAFPLIATGVYGFPRAEALQIAVSEFSSFLKDNDMQILLVVFDKKSFVLSGKIYSGVDSYIEENSVTETLSREYRIDGASESERRGRYNRPGLFGRRMEAASQGVPEDFADEEDDVYAEYDLEEACSVEESNTHHVLPTVALSSAAPKADSLKERVAHVGDTWQQSLLHWIDRKQLKDTDVYKRANVDRKLFSKIRSNKDYQPKKITAVALALALELDLDETKDFLGRAGYALSPGSVFDLIIEYFIENGVYDYFTINLALFEHDQPTLGV